MAKSSFIDVDRVRKAHSVRHVEPIFQHLTEDKKPLMPLFR